MVQQDHVGGLHVKYGGFYVDVKPLPGALVINIGDLLQVIECSISNIPKFYLK